MAAAEGTFLAAPESAALRQGCSCRRSAPCYGSRFCLLCCASDFMARSAPQISAGLWPLEVGTAQAAGQLAEWEAMAEDFSGHSKFQSRLLYWAYFRICFRAELSQPRIHAARWRING